MSRDRYFDNAATTPLDPRVREAMLPFLDEGFGNPNSLHSFGAFARDAVERAREKVAHLIGAEDPYQIVFTSGATESNNWVIRAFPGGVMSPFEHSAVREPGLAHGYALLKNDGFRLEPPTDSFPLVSVMSVNNETGAIWSPAEYRSNQAPVHSDITQAVGKIPLDLEGVDFASLSAHKFYGPKGVGALFIANDAPDPLLQGGEQEHGRRAGTLNVAAIVGMGVAAEIAQEEQADDHTHATELRGLVLDGLGSTSDWHVWKAKDQSPFILSLSFLGVEGETIVVEADRVGFALSSGAACSSGSNEPSHVLVELGATDAWRRGTIRISFGRSNNVESTAKLAKTLPQIVEKLRTVR